MGTYFLSTRKRTCSSLMGNSLRHTTMTSLRWPHVRISNEIVPWIRAVTSVLTGCPSVVSVQMVQRMFIFYTKDCRILQGQYRSYCKDPSGNPRGRRARPGVCVYRYLRVECPRNHRPTLRCTVNCHRDTHTTLVKEKRNESKHCFLRRISTTIQ
jgi:hypothetical protein